MGKKGRVLFNNGFLVDAGFIGIVLGCFVLWVFIG
jgi:hypothetical protein